MRKNKKEVTLTSVNKKGKEKKVVRNTAQSTIPFLEFYENGLVLVEKEKSTERFCMVFSLSNANYQILKEEQQEQKANIYKSIFNMLSPDISYQEIYQNVPLDSQKVIDAIAPADMQRDTPYAECYYKNQLEFIKGIESSISDTRMFFALSYTKKSKLDNAFNILMQNYAKISEKFEELGAQTSILSPTEILKLLYSIYNPFDENGFSLPADMYARGTNIRDYIAPSAFYFKPSHTALGSDFNRTFFVSGYSSTLDDSFITSVLDNKFKIVVSKHIVHVDKDIALKNVNNRLKELEADRQSRNQRNKKEGTSYIPLDLERDIQGCVKILDDLQEKEELFDVGIYINISAQTIEDLEDITKIIMGTCREHLVTIRNAVWRQEDGLASVLPFATNKLPELTHYLLSSGVAVTLPFTYEKVFSPTGFYYGKNSITKNYIIIDRKDDINGNSFVLGASGSGKSLFGKMEINDVYFRTNDKIIIIDPEREFTKQAKKVGGTVIKISPNTKNYLNPFDVTLDNEKGEDMIRNKADLILSIFAAFKDEKLTPQEKTIVDRCTLKAYSNFIQNGYRKEDIPTFVDYKAILDEQTEKESKDLSLYLEMYVTGSLDLFSHQSNVDLSNRVVVFDLLELGANIKKVGMLIVLDFIWNEMVKNNQKNTYTWLYVDEFHLFYGGNDDNNSCGVYFERVFARCRKFMGLATGLTQNVTGVIQSQTALGMLQNSQFVVLLQQAKENRNAIASLYELSDAQKSKLIKPKKGEGLIVSKNIVIPFNKLYPNNNLVYDIITTDPKDRNKEEKETVGAS